MPAQRIAPACRHRRCRQTALAAQRREYPGTPRRLQALACMGWEWRVLSERLGPGPDAVRQAAEGTLWPLPRWLISAVDALYDEIWYVPGSSPEAARIARRRGWAPPMAWDDDRPGDLFYTGHGIDDPDGVPAPGWRRPPQRRDADLAAELADLQAMGLNVNQAAIRLHLSGARLTRLRDLLAAS